MRHRAQFIMSVYSSFCHDLVELMKFTDELRSLYLVLYVVNALSSAVSTITNIMVILAVQRTASLRSPSFIMIFTLAITDLGVGLIVQPLYIAARIAETGDSKDEYCLLSMAYRVAVVCLSGLSFFIMTLISIDRFLAIHLCMKYRLIVTTKRTILVSLLLGIVAAVWALTVVFSPKSPYILSMFVVPVCLVTTSFNYLNINRILKKQQNKFQFNSTSIALSSSSGGTRMETVNTSNGRYRRVLQTMIYVYIAFVVCYLPYLCYLFALLSVGQSVSVQRARHLTATIIFLKSSISPALYFWRIANIRKAVWKLFY